MEFIRVPLTANGARDVSVEWSVEPQGLVKQVPVGRVVLDVRWTTPA